VELFENWTKNGYGHSKIGHKSVEFLNIRYSHHLKTKPWSVFRFDLMPVPGILKPDHLKPGLFGPDFEWSLA
jgi:hypothetical protein